MNKSICAIDWNSHKGALMQIETACFDTQASDEADLEHQLSKGFGYIVSSFLSAKPVGYVIAMPLEKAPYTGCIEDSHRGLQDTAYIESLAIADKSNPILLLQLVRHAHNDLLQRGYSRITMHVETDGGLHKTFKRVGAKDLQQFDNWMGWDLPYTYLEKELKK